MSSEWGPKGGRKAYAVGRWMGLCILMLASCATPWKRYEYGEFRMGTELRVIVHAEDRDLAASAVAAAFERATQLEAALSDYRPTSELSRLSWSAVGTPRVVSPDLFAVLERAEFLRSVSAGAFDVTVGPYVALWRRSVRQGALPSAERLREARARVGDGVFSLDREAHSVTMHVADARLDLGGVAKGYIADRMLALLVESGFPRALVDIGGDVAVGEPPPGTMGWRVALAGHDASAAPTEFVELQSCGIATSGDQGHSVEIAGLRYSHVIDPRTGLGMTARRTATAIAPDAATADALASAACVLDPAESMAMSTRVDGASLRVLAVGEATREEFRSPGFPPLRRHE
ncbi:MAG: FAD:protein FMN transferase [Planctomycetota bacterium]